MVKVIKFEKDGCIPCKVVGDFLSKNGVNVDESINPFDNPELAMQYKVRGVPKTILVVDDKVELEFNGASVDDLNNFVEQYNKNKV